MQSKVEMSLSQSNEKMSKILQESRNLEAQKEFLVERTEKLKLAHQKIQSLETELNEKKDVLTSSEKTKKALIVEKSELESQLFALETRFKQKELRLQAINEQLDEALIENSKLQSKLNNKNNSFVQSVGESVELLKANYERDEHKWNAEKLSLNSKV